VEWAFLTHGRSAGRVQGISGIRSAARRSALLSRSVRGVGVSRRANLNARLFRPMHKYTVFNKILKLVVLSVSSLSFAANGQAFRNLNFEEPALEQLTNINEPRFEVLFPGWQTVIPPGGWAALYYDIVMDSPSGYTLSDSEVDTQFGWAHSEVLSGRHSAILVVSGFGRTNSLGLQQNGLIPSEAKSVRFTASPRSLDGNSP